MFRRSQNKIQDPAKLKRLISDLLPVRTDDALRQLGIKRYTIVATNVSCGRKSSIKVIGEQGDVGSKATTYQRHDFWATTSNKQLNFVQHIKSLLTIKGRATVEEFVSLYQPGAIQQRQPTWSEQTPDGRWRCYELEDLLARDKISLDLFRLKDDSLLDSDILPEPDVIGSEIAPDLRSVLEPMEEMLGDLEPASSPP